MKLTIALTLLLTVQLSASVYSQNTKMNLQLSNVTLLELLQSIESNSEFKFFYNNDEIDVSRKVSINASDKEVGAILKEVFENTPYSFKVMKNNLIILENAGETGLSVSQQQKTVAGKVADSSGQPLPGVTVVVKGTTQGIITDTNGSYSLSNVLADATLVFSFVGMKTQEIPVAGKMEINVKLEEETVGIEEVVAVGYGSQRKVNLTGSVVDIKNDKLVNIPVANITSSLAGKLPGVVAIQRSGEPGQDAASISIRGFGSALTIVDGVERSFDQIDPNEIESISVLKDASAAIYGARAGNGVILVTTKRGKTGKPLINISINSGYQSNTRLPDLVNSGEFAESFNDALVNGGSPALYSDFQVKAYKYVSGDKSVKFTDAEKAQFESEKANFVNTDLLGLTFKPVAPIQQYNLSSTGGNDKIKYFLSMGYLDQQSVLRSGDDNFKKYSIRSNIDAQITKNLSVGFDLSGRLQEAIYPGYTIGSIWNAFLNDVPTIVHNPDPAYPTGMGQAFAEADISGTRKNATKELSGSFSLDYSVPFVKGLSAKARFDYLANQSFDKNFLKAFNLYAYDPINDKYSVTVNGYVSNTSLTETYAESRFLISKWILNYDHVFGKHEVKAFVVGEYTDYNRQWLSAYRDKYYTTAIDQLFAGSSTGMKNDGSESVDGRISYAGRFNYAYSGKYLLETTFRYDASPRFFSDQRWGFFPSVLVGWRLSEERFVKENLQFINNLKFRLSYGQSGVDNIASYNYLSGYNYSGGFVDNGAMQTGIVTKGLANILATWEKHTTYNAGFDFDLWNSKIFGSFDAFYKQRSGILAKRTEALPNTFGAALPSENLNSMNYRGFELQLGHKGKIRGIEYSVDGNIAWNRAKNDHIEEADYSGSDEYTRLRYQQSGQWTNRYFGLEAVGLFQSQDEINAWTVIQDNNNNKTIRPGDIKYLDYNGDNKITDIDYHPIGKGNIPELTYGVNFNGKWKGFDLSMLWQGASNYGIILPTQRPYPFNKSNLFRFQLDYWTPENTDAKYPRIGLSGFSNNKYPSTYWLISAYYIRLKNIQLGYSLPSQIFGKIGVSSCRLYLSAVNLLTISNVNYFDPETASTADNYGFFPQQKTISFGVNLSF